MLREREREWVRHQFMSTCDTFSMTEDLMHKKMTLAINRIRAYLEYCNVTPSNYGLLPQDMPPNQCDILPHHEPANQSRCLLVLVCCTRMF
jgi:hypothetical protein